MVGMSLLAEPTLSWLARSRSYRVRGRCGERLRLNRTTRDWNSGSVTLSPSTSLRINSMKGLTTRFFAALRMTMLNGRIARCINIMCFDLAYVGEDWEARGDDEGL